MTLYRPMFPLTRRVQALLAPDTALLRRIDEFHGKVSLHTRNTGFVCEGELDQRTGVIVSGWMLRTHLLSDGRRQILGLLLPGDLVNFSLYTAVPSFCDSECGTDVEVADLTELRRHVMFDRVQEPLTQAIWLLIALEEAIAMNAVARLTRQSAQERVAHLMLDLHYRLSLVGGVSDGAFEMPLTQQALSETLGLSVVHVNRVLMQLKREGLVERDKRYVRIPDPARLRRIVEHTPPSIGNAGVFGGDSGGLLSSPRRPAFSPS